MKGVEFDFAGAKVLVTGGSSGIGGGIALAYRDAGADVTITGTRGSASDYDVDLSGFRYLQLDVEDVDSIDRVIAAQDELDILINNAGIALPSLGLDEYQPDNFARALNIHLMSGYRLAWGFHPALSRSMIEGGASLIGIASMASYFGIGHVPGYGVAKTGLVGMVRVLAVAWASKNIRVNAVAAGLTETRMTAAAFVPDSPWSAPTLARTPAGRLGTPADIAGPVLFLTSPAASWITGQTLPVDGGFTVAG